MDGKFEALLSLRAAEFKHIDGSLLEHLEATRALLKEWDAPKELLDAGLYHAAYGTVGFDQYLVSLKQREKIINIIGAEAEEIVYQYCACERASFYEQFLCEHEPLFFNRFTGTSYYLTRKMLQFFCELTAANEIEIAIRNPAFIELHAKSLGSILNSMAPFLSGCARRRITELF